MKKIILLLLISFSLSFTSVQIAENGKVIDITIDGVTDCIHKDGSSVALNNGTVVLAAASQRTYRLDFNDVTSPSVASATDLRDEIVKLLNNSRNIKDSATLPSITLNNSTSTKIADANPDRQYFQVNNNSAASAVWLKLQAASVDDDKKGIYLNKTTVIGDRWEMPTDAIYTGEISAIAVVDGPTVYVTEY